MALANRGWDLARRARALNSLGSILTTDQPQEARANHEAALELSTRSLDRYEQARALDGIAATNDYCGDRADAHRLWLEALSIHTALEVPEAEVTRIRLAATDDRAASGRTPYEIRHATGRVARPALSGRGGRSSVPARAR